MVPQIANAVRDTLSGLTPAALAGFALVVLGIVVALFGARLIRPTLALACVLGGAAAGLFAATALRLGPVAGIPEPAAGAVAGMLAGIILSLALYRVAVGALTAASIGLAAGAVAWSLPQTAADRGPDRIEIRSDSSKPDETTEDPLAAVLGQMGELREQIEERLGTLRAAGPDAETPPAARASANTRPEAARAPAWAGALTERAEGIVAAARARWADSGSDRRWTATAAAIAGALAGLLVGVLAPKRAGALATGLVGAALLAGGTALAMAETGGAWAAGLDQPAWVWAGAPMLIGLFAAATQRGSSGKKPKPAAAD